MAKLSERRTVRLRTVRLEEVARYLACDPKKLRIALQHLSAVPSAIHFSKSVGVSILPAVPYITPTPEAAAGAAAYRALVAMAQSALDKIVSAAHDRLDRAGGGKDNYSFVEIVASVEAEEAAKEKVRYQAVKPTLTRYLTMKPADEKWLN